ncbi:MAG: DUF3365 domain-containing protein [Desulfobacterales bacterium]|nr:DUF3365 domain-containing protein [Desulfobacterales bacterium]
MRSVATRLLVYMGAATLLFSIFLLYHTYSLTKKRVREVVEQQATLVLKFDLAIRAYIGHYVRPSMRALLGEDEFEPETMSTSFVARKIFEDVRHEFPDYILKFSSDNPRNPANQAGPEELEIIDYLNKNPRQKRWDGEITIAGKRYMALFSARRMKESCLLCHGDPADAPASLLKKYGSTAGFHRPMGEIIGLDTVAIPMSRINEKLWSESIRTFVAVGAGLVFFFGAIAMLIRRLIINRLTLIARHFADATNQTHYSRIEPVKVKGVDEIANLAASFNTLIDKLRHSHASLEDSVQKRTRELEEKNKQLSREIEERRLAEGALRESELQHRNILDSMGDFIHVVDRDLNIVLINSALKRLIDSYGLNRDVVGRRLFEAFPFLSRNAADEYRRVFETEEMRITEEEFEIKEKEIITETRKIPLLEGRTVVGVVSVIREITRQKQMDRKRMELETKIRRIQKMEVVGTLAGGVAHDLNNILSGIVGYPELLLLDLPEDSPFRKPIQEIRRSGERAAAIVQDLLTLARRGVAIDEVVNLNEIVSNYLMSPEFKRLLTHHPMVDVKTDLAPDVLNILASPAHISKTVMNLISNAAEAMPDGGAISLSTENRYIDRPTNGYDDVAEGDYVALTVADDGVGISPDDRERIFEPFYTKKNMGRSGTGLGMAVVWGSVKDHQGFIDIESDEGEGTTFTLFFPVTRQGASLKEPKLALEDFMGDNQSILVVDDVKTQREIASSMLSKIGYSVTTVSSGEAALEYMRNNTADLLVLDMIMDPGIDGLETYKGIIQLHPGQKAIIASGFAETSRVREAQKLGAGAYLKKPYTLENIGVAVKAELER